MSQETIDRPGPDVDPNTMPDDNGHRQKTQGQDEGTIWVVNDRSPEVLRSRFYKALLLGVSCIFQLAIAGEVLALYGPLTFFAFTLGVVICAGIAAEEMGSLLSAIDMRFGALKKVLWNQFEDASEDPTGHEIPRV